MKCDRLACVGRPARAGARALAMPASSNYDQQPGRERRGPEIAVERRFPTHIMRRDVERGVANAYGASHALHSGKTSAAVRFSCWHRRHSCALPTRRAQITLRSRRLGAPPVIGGPPFDQPLGVVAVDELIDAPARRGPRREAMRVETPLLQRGHDALDHAGAFGLADVRPAPCNAGVDLITVQKLGGTDPSRPVSARRKCAILEARRASLNWQGSGLEIHRAARPLGVRIPRPPPFFCYLHEGQAFAPASRVPECPLRRL
jgi:hypothetical protein